MISPRGSARRSMATIVAGAGSCAVLVLSAAGCSTDRNATDLRTTTSGVATTTSVLTPATVPVTVPVTTSAATTVAPTTAAPTTTVAPTTTTAVPTTTTELPGADLPLRFDGIGDVRFGSDPDDVITYLSGQLGDPTAATGWVTGAEVGCAGNEARVVFWNDLRLTFGDESNVSSGRRHFFSWRFGPPAETSLQPAGMETLLGISIGSTVAQLQQQYPAVQLFAADASTTPSAQLAEGLFAYLTDTTPSGVVTQLIGGEDCSG